MRADIVGVGGSLMAIVVSHEFHGADEVRELRNLAGDRRRRVDVEIAEAVVPLRARDVNVIAQADI